MNIDDIITLDDGKKYYIFDIVEYNNVKYYFSVHLLDNDQIDMKDFKFFTFEVENNEEYVTVVDDPQILVTLYTLEASSEILDSNPDGERILMEFAKSLETIETE